MLVNTTSCISRYFIHTYYIHHWTIRKPIFFLVHLKYLWTNLKRACLWASNHFASISHSFVMTVYRDQIILLNFSSSWNTNLQGSHNKSVFMMRWIVTRFPLEIPLSNLLLDTPIFVYILHFQKLIPWFIFKFLATVR